jgi:molecular chaperone GrpE
MSEFPPPGIAANAAVGAVPALTPEAVSAVLDDFRAWLMALVAAESLSPPTPLPSGERGEAPAPLSPLGRGVGGEGADAIDLHTLLAQFIAVRQEVNLQTRAVRAQQEQNAETLRQLTAALETLRQSQTRGDEARQQEIDEALRPLLKTLIDAHDALALAGREMQRLSETVMPNLEQLDSPTEAPLSPSLSRSLFRLFHRKRHLQEEQERERARERERVRQLLASLMTGYTMSLQRIERALRQHGLQAIPTTGERFDPELMEVVEAVADSGRPSGEVIEEVRRGYLWDGRVFRYAQVRVAKG